VQDVIHFLIVRTFSNIIAHEDQIRSRSMDLQEQIIEGRTWKGSIILNG